MEKQAYQTTVTILVDFDDINTPTNYAPQTFTSSRTIWAVLLRGVYAVQTAASVIHQDDGVTEVDLPWPIGPR